MRQLAIDDLALLPEGEALQQHFDSRNWRVLRWVLPFSLLLSIVGLVATLDQARPLAFVLYVLNLAVTVGIFGSRKEPWFARHYRRIQTAYLFLQVLTWSPFSIQVPEGPKAVAAIPFVLIFLRLWWVDAALLFGSFWLRQSVPLAALEIGSRPFDPGWTAAALVLLGLSQLWTHVERKRFLALWRREHHKARERLRMREEIDYARKIQLSMLPPGGPGVDWLDLAAVSMPATEVGGDYYDWFRLSASRVALVVGDVSGHGLASGLLLSGVRSCLYLLEAQLGAPARVLARLSPMVRRTTDRRMYVTLLDAVLDREAGTLTVASAGHPPVLRRAAGASAFDEVGKGAPPLGTFRDARFEDDVRPLAPGDLLLFYTDGLVEARDARGREYGYEGLLRALSRTSTTARAADVREEILSDFAHFRGDAEPADDVTLVVVRVL